MKNSIILAFAFLISSFSFAQPTVGMDFDALDCNGTNQHLFADLEQGNVVIIEYFMLNCGSCIVAGNLLEDMKTNLETQFPGKIKSYAIGFQDSYTCTNISAWVTNNGFSSIPMDKGAEQVAYYGGMGMPTVVVLGGNDHLILGEPFIGVETSDTALMANSIRVFFGEPSLGIQESDVELTNFTFYPNPVNTVLTIDFPYVNEALFTVFDVNGRKLKQSSVSKSSSHTMDLSDLQNGTYFLKATTEKGSALKKITVNR